MRRVLLTLSLVLAPLCASTLVAAASTSEWKIESGPIDPKNYFGETVANGMIGIVSSPRPFAVAQTMLNGVYDIGDAGVDVMLHGFDILALNVSIDGTRIQDPEQVTNYRQTLDLKHGRLTTSFDISDKASVSYTWYALRGLPHSAVSDVTVTAHRDLELAAESSLPIPRGFSPVQRALKTFQDGESPPLPLPYLAAAARSPTGRVTVAASTAFRFETWSGAPEVTKPSSPEAHSADGLAFKTKIASGQRFNFSLIASTLTSEQKANPLVEASRLTIAATLQGRDKLVAQHERAWEQLWQSDIRIDGDPAIQRDVRAMLYHLYAFAREGTGYSLSPMGLSGTGYGGHIFWDTETWMYPVLLALQPEIAKSLLTYRTDRLPAAKRNALTNGFKGAMYPWESAASGDEETPLCCVTGPFEHHITADVGNAIWQFFQVTKDKQWLRTQGWPVLLETANFWVSRVERNVDGKYDINGVVPADEWAGVVDNSAFTNAAAKANLKAAISAARALGVPAKREWQQVHDNIRILKFPDGVTREHATYVAQPVKQADVNLMSFPLKEVTDMAAIRRDLDFYKPKIGVGPAMTRSIFAILHARLGEPDLALAEFKRGYEENRRPPFGVLAETVDNNEVYFATAAGGLLQTMLFGFGGLDISDRGIVQRGGILPNGWKSLTIVGVGPAKKTYAVNANSRKE